MTPTLDLSLHDGAAFDLDGVVTDTARVHAAAWKRLFDELGSGPGALAFTPFDSVRDYDALVDGKPRMDGIRDFLASRHIVLPPGGPGDAPDARTLHALSLRKEALFLAQLQADGVHVFPDAIELLERLRMAGVRIAVVSSSENTASILARAGLEMLFDVRIDGLVARELGLAGKPAPDVFLEAARRLDCSPARMVGFEDAVSGVAALHAAGYACVVGIDRKQQTGGDLRAKGADVVIANLREISLGDALSREPRDEPALPPYAIPTVDPTWAIRARGFDPAREHDIESLLTVGNGHVGIRGSTPEGNSASSPATYVAGVFHGAATTPQLVVAPDWTHWSLQLDGRPIRLEVGRTLSHERTLDMRQAILFRHWRHRDDAGRVTRIGSLRIASMAHRATLLQSILLEPENYSATLCFDDGPEESSFVTSAGTVVALAARTIASDVTDGAPHILDLTGDGALPVEPGRRYLLDRIACLRTSRDADVPLDAARQDLADAAAPGLTADIDAHLSEWTKLWRACDVRIEGDPALQRELRFAIYHLLIAANPADPRTSIGARSLTGSGYRGHVFWDTEIFVLPFYTLTVPAAARALLMYRHFTLPEARRRAATIGCEGALFAWESADTGEDVTPATVVFPDGTLVPVLTGQLAHHISADVAYACWQYWRATGDDAFALEAGAELIVETARFWASRVRRGTDGLHHIDGVIGPDEYHVPVDDNAYTNGMARWNLTAAARTTQILRERWPARWEALSAQWTLGSNEVAYWEHIAASMYSGFDAHTGLIEQFRGYFGLEDIDPATLEPRTAPVDVVLGRDRVQRSQLIKQPDVVMLLHLLWDEFTPEVRERNFRYYEARCVQGSSLSPAIHALVAARIGDLRLALRHLRQAAGIDLDARIGDSSGGVHIGALGGLWQAVCFGIGGLTLSGSSPALMPHLPAGWRELAFPVHWHGEVHPLSARTPRSG